MYALGGAFTPGGGQSAGGPARGTSPFERFGTRTPGSGRGLGRSDLGAGARTPGRRFVRRSLTPAPTMSGGRTPRGPGGSQGGDPWGPGGSQGASDGHLSHEQEMLVWGTNVNINDSKERFGRFFHGFLGESNLPKYPVLLRETILAGGTALNLDCSNLESYDPDLYMQLVHYPQEIIPIFDLETDSFAQEVVQELGEDGPMEPYRIQVRTFNLRESKSMRLLDPQDIDQLVSLQGMVTRVSSVVPELKQAQLKCGRCGHEPDLVPVDRGRVEFPPRCPRPECNAEKSMELEHSRSFFGNKQVVKLQETPENIPEGETARTMTMYLFDDMVDVVKPGDRVTVTGVYRAVAARVNPRVRTLKSVFRTYVDVIHVSKEETRHFAELLSAPSDAGRAEGSEGYVEGDTTRSAQEERVAELQELARDPEILDKLVASLAPSVWELDDVKKGILCLLFGGARKELGEDRTRFRGEINCLLCGDPGTSKSQLLSYVHKLAPRGIYTSGRGSSAVGLTAHVTRDPDTRDMVLESGALVLSDMGVCCIDEFDKMSEGARSILHEVMEQQTVSLAKAGIICTLNARTSVLASANPVGSRYNPAISVVENLQLPPSLMSRFDLIFLMLDKADKVTDSRLARHLVALHYEVPPESRRSVIPAKLLRDYIAYARATCMPSMSNAAAESIVNSYVEMRQMGSVGSVKEKVVTATPRQLEGLIRIAESLAKMQLAQEVTREHVEEAYRLIKVAMQQSATDPRTGKIDMDLIQTGVSASTRSARKQLAQELTALLQKLGAPAHVNDLLRDIRSQAPGVDISPNEIREALRLLVEDRAADMMGDVVRLVA